MDIIITFGKICTNVLFEKLLILINTLPISVSSHDETLFVELHEEHNIEQNENDCIYCTNILQR